MMRASFTPDLCSAISHSFASDSLAVSARTLRFTAHVSPRIWKALQFCTQYLAASIYTLLLCSRQERAYWKEAKPHYINLHAAR